MGFFFLGFLISPIFSGWVNCYPQTLTMVEEQLISFSLQNQYVSFLFLLSDSENAMQKSADIRVQKRIRQVQ